MSSIVPYLPWVALAVAIVAVFARDGARGPSEAPKLKAPAGSFILLAILVAAAMVAAWKWPQAANGVVPAIAGFSIGALLSAVAYGIGLLPGQANAGRSAPIALAAAAVSFSQWYGDKAILALVFGAAAASWMLSLGKSTEPNPWAMRSAVYAGAIVGCNLLSAHWVTGADAGHFGTILAVIGSIAGMVAALFAGVLRKGTTPTPTSSMLAGFIAALFWSGGMFLLGRRDALPNEATIVFAGSALVALVVAWLVPEDLVSGTVRILLAAILWIAVATAAFGLQHGFGMSLALISGAGVLLLCGHRRALLSLGPLAALVIYRVFREAHPASSQAFDIGQHYALIGVLLGAVIPVMAQEWLRVSAKRAGGAMLIAGALWVLLMAAAPIPIAIALSDKGIIGYLVGLGFAPVLDGVRGERSANTVALSLGLGSAMALIYDWIYPYLDLDRHGKLIALSWVMGIALVAAFVIAALSSESFRLKEAPEPA